MSGYSVRGKVIAFDADVGLGKIEADDGAVYDFHCVEITDGTRTIDVGMSVSFERLAKLGRFEASHITKR